MRPRLATKDAVPVLERAEVLRPDTMHSHRLEAAAIAMYRSQTWTRITAWPDEMNHRGAINLRHPITGRPTWVLVNAVSGEISESHSHGRSISTSSPSQSLSTISE